MFKKRHIMLILLSLMMCLVAIASVSAVDSDAAGDDVVSDVANEDNVALEEDSSDDVASDVEENDVVSDAEAGDVVASEGNNDVLTYDDDDYYDDDYYDDDYYDDDYYDDDYKYATISAKVTSKTYYQSKSQLRVTVKDENGNPADAYVKVVFKKGSETITKTDRTYSDGGFAMTLPNELSVGTWKITVSLDDYEYYGSDVTKTVKITKSSVKIKLKKVSQYQGIKFKLKATVKNKAGKKVNEGKVKFKIKGKTYYAAVKNGVATKKIKIGKVGKYKLSAKYMGNKNLNKKSAKKVKVKIKKRYKTKVTANKKLYKMTYGNTVTIKLKVKTTSGKRVKGGYIDVYNKETGNYLGWVKVSKKGKATVKLTLAHNYISGNGYTSFYKKVVYSKYKMKYSPTTYKYKCSSKTVKIKEKYKCQYCGKTKSHKHNMGYYMWHIYVN